MTLTANVARPASTVAVALTSSGRWTSPLASVTTGASRLPVPGWATLSTKWNDFVALKVVCAFCSSVCALGGASPQPARTTSASRGSVVGVATREYRGVPRLRVSVLSTGLSFTWRAVCRRHYPRPARLRQWRASAAGPASAQPGLDRSLVALGRRLVVGTLAKLLRQIVLRALGRPAQRVRRVGLAGVIVVRIGVALAVVELFHQARRRVAQVHRHGIVAGRAHAPPSPRPVVIPLLPLRPPAPLDHPL